MNRFQTSTDICFRHRNQLFALLLIWFVGATQPVRGAETIEMEVRETAGLARRGFPTHVNLQLPSALPATTPFRLLRDGKPIFAQFRAEGNQPTIRWWLDFQADLEPNERRRYQIEFGEDVTKSPELPTGHRLNPLTDRFEITHSPYLTWKLARDLKSVVPSLAFQAFEFMKPDSPGLILRTRKGQKTSWTGPGKVVRHGPMTVALQYQDPPRQTLLPEPRSTVDLTLPGPVSWVEIRWVIDDPLDEIAAAGFELNLNLDPGEPTAPTLVDFGAGHYTYLALQQGQSADLVAKARESQQPGVQQAWELRRLDANSSTLVATHSPLSPNVPVEGWAHIMDRKKCLALAVEDFAVHSTDQIQLTSGGNVSYVREFPIGKKNEKKQLRFWLHFVFFPPQWSASTSPRQMQTPLEVTFPSNP